MVEVQHDMEAVLHEAKRLLRPGGEFRFGPDGPWIRPLRADQWDAWFDLLEKVHQGGVLSPEEDDWRMRISPGYEREEERTKELQGLSPTEQVRARAKHTLVDLHALDSSITEHRFTRVIEWPGKNRQQHNSESAYYVVTK
jgi:SAM-dependent methyltransferase